MVNLDNGFYIAVIITALTLILFGYILKKFG